MKDENQPAPDSEVLSLSRGASAAERIAEDIATEMTLSKGLRCQMTRRMKTGGKKSVLMCVSNIARHGCQAYIRIRGDRNVLQCEAVAPFFPCGHQNQAPDQKSMKHVQPLH